VDETLCGLQDDPAKAQIAGFGLLLVWLEMVRVGAGVWRKNALPHEESERFTKAETCECKTQHAYQS
jgi:hypothetical protein